MTSPNSLANASVLDCTLRDGGYYTAWDFSDSTVHAYLAAMARLPVDTVELGYLNNPKNDYFGRFHYLNQATTEWARGALAPNQRLAVMFDDKAVEPSDVRKLLSPHRGSVDLVRIAVPPNRLDHAADLASEVREMGIDVGINIMYLSKYWDRVSQLEPMLRIAELSYAISLVDSYGAVTPDQTYRAISELRQVTPSTTIGFHGHDNLGLAVANSLSATAAGASIVDGTVTGIGRGPGNSKLETLMVLKSAHDPSTLDFVALHSGMEPLESLQKEYGWGTNLAYMISGAAGLPQNEVMDWLGKNRYSVPAIVSALQGDQENQVDTKEYPPLTSDTVGADEAIIIGGGETAAEHTRAIVAYADSRDAFVIHATLRHPQLIGAFSGPEILCLAGNATGPMPEPSLLAKLETVVVPTAPRFKGIAPMNSTRINSVHSFGSNDGNLGPVDDVGPLAIALGSAIQSGACKVTLVGFDGYSNASAAQQDLAGEIQQMIDAFSLAYPRIQLVSGTRSRYAISVDSIYADLATYEPAQKST